jgi:hypothetical protein
MRTNELALPRGVRRPMDDERVRRQHAPCHSITPIPLDLTDQM